MSIFKSIGKAIGGVGKFVGKAASKIAPVAGIIPGVGPLAAAALGAGGNLLSGKNVLKGALSGGLGALTGGLGGIAGLLGKAAPGIAGAALPAAAALMGSRGAGGNTGPYTAGFGGDAANYIAQGAPPQAPGFGGNVGDYLRGGWTAPTIPGATQPTQAGGGGGGGILGFLGKAASGIGNWVKDNPVTALGGGLAAIQAINAAKQGQRADRQIEQGTYDAYNPYMNPAARLGSASKSANAALMG